MKAMSGKVLAWRGEQSKEGAVSTTAIVTTNGWCGESPEFVAEDRPKLLLGMPCVRCRAYYDAKLKFCPVCKEREAGLPGGQKMRPKRRVA
jgi:hypothetical protein